MKTRLNCVCGASAADNSKERGRFKRRHGSNCPRIEQTRVSRALAKGTRSVEPTTWEEHHQLRDGDK